MNSKKLIKQATYHDNGNKCEEGFYKDGKREGECISFYENGEKELASYFKTGKHRGIWMHWDNDGYYDWVDMDLNSNKMPL